MAATPAPAISSWISSMPLARSDRSPAAYLRKKLTGRLSRRSQTAAWTLFCIRDWMRIVVTPCTNLKAAVASAENISATPNTNSVSRSACGIASSKILPVKYGVAEPNRPMAMAVNSSHLMSLPSPRAAKAITCRTVSEPSRNGR